MSIEALAADLAAVRVVDDPDGWALAAYRLAVASSELATRPEHLAEAGLAVATSLSAGVQVLVLMLLFSRGKGPLGWSALAATTLRTVAATALMTAAGYAALLQIASTDTLWNELVRVFVPLTVAVLVYAVTYRLLRGRELGMLLRGIGDGE